MVPTELKDFFIATIGASASFIGLLFVALSFTMNDRLESEAAHETKRILAESSYAALLSVFFISLVALIPGAVIGWVMLVLALGGIGSSIHQWQLGAQIRQNAATLTFSIILYAVQAVYGIYIIMHRHHVISKYGIMTLVIFLFSLALGRAWELTGIRSGHK